MECNNFKIRTSVSCVIAVIALLLSIPCLNGCSDAKNITENYTVDTSENTKTIETTVKDAGKNKMVAKITKDDKFTLDFPLLGLMNQKILMAQCGGLVAEAKEYDAQTMIIAEEQENHLDYLLRLVVQASDSVLVTELGLCNASFMEDNYYDLIDLDGDGDEEIFLCICMSGNGIWITQVYDVVDSKLRFIGEWLGNYGDESDADNIYHSDFTAKTVDADTVRLISEAGGCDVEYKRSVPLPEDEEESSMHCYAPMYAYCIDEDRDGVSTIVCRQEVKLETGEIPGIAVTEWQYDAVAHGFVIINANFEPVE